MATILKPGMTGSLVKALQQFLIGNNFLARGLDTGNYGPLTEAAVREYDRAIGLPDDGVADAATLEQAQRDGLVLPTRDFSRRVNIPANINQGLTPMSPAAMMRLLGAPGALTADCSRVTNVRLAKLLKTQNVGPFTLTGLVPALAAVERIFAIVKATEPELHAQLQTEGMLCCRAVRLPDGRPGSSFSIHAWGAAVDLKFNGVLDDRADGKTQEGLAIIAPLFNDEKFFWGAGFDAAHEDSMHFEASAELMQEWKTQGLLD